jgi:hypothetical protein
MVTKDKQAPVIFRRIEEAIEQLFTEKKLPIFCSIELLQKEVTQLLTTKLKQPLPLKQSLLSDLEAMNSDLDVWVDLCEVSTYWYHFI